MNVEMYKLKMKQNIKKIFVFRNYVAKLQRSYYEVGTYGCFQGNKQYLTSA